MQAAITAAKAAYLASGGTITVVPGFTEVAPIGKPPKPTLSSKNSRSSQKTVGRGWIAKQLGLSARYAFSSEAPFSHLLEPPRINAGGRWDVEHARAIVEAVKAWRIKHSGAMYDGSAGEHVDRNYICKQLDLSRVIFTERWPLNFLLPKPVTSEGSNARRLYLKTEADEAIRKIKLIRSVK